MARRRIHALAHDLGLSVEELLGRLRTAGLSVRGPASLVDEAAAREASHTPAAGPGPAPGKPKTRKRQGVLPAGATPQRDPNEGGAGRVRIKKYGNRRLYSTAESRYLTLEDLERLVRAGREVEVVDAKTHEDLTSQVLTQILLEGGRAGSLPPAFLQELIRLGDEAVQTWLNRVVHVGRDALVAAQQEMERRYQTFMGGGGWPFSPFATPFFPRPEAPQGAPERPAEVDSLRRRIEELERRLAGQGTQPQEPKSPKNSKTK